LEIPGVTFESLQSFVEFVRTLGAWEKEHATLDNVLEFILDSHLSGNNLDARNFKKWKARQSSAEE